MNTTELSALTKNFFFWALTIMILPPFQSRAKKVAPAAGGDVTVKKDKNGNYLINIEILNLDEIDKLMPGKKAYVVWMEADQDLTRNIGLITGSGQLIITFETVSEQQPKRIFITAEEDKDVKIPGSMVVLTTGIIY